MTAEVKPRLRALVIDDDEVDRTNISRLLKKACPGVIISEATDSASAAAKCTPPPDIALIDYRMASENGIHVMQELRHIAPDTTCFIVTGQGDEQIAKDAIRAGALDYISKPRLTAEAMQRMIATGMELAETRSRLRDRQAELQVFADVLVHDLKAPVRAVDFFSEQLVTSLQSGTQEDVDTELRLLRQAAQQIRALIDSLACHLQVDREAEFADNDIRTIVDATCLSLETVIRESGAEVINAAGNYTVRSCAPQLGQLIQNLVANAIKFSGDKKPRIRIETELTEGGTLRLSVSDNGVGIAPEHLDRVFEPFTRAPTSNGISGTGLGLATCRKVANRHKGKIWCESELGVGTKVILELPDAKAAPEAAE